MNVTLGSLFSNSFKIFVSKIKTGKTGTPDFNAWYSPALSSSRRSRRNQKILMEFFNLNNNQRF